MNINDMVVATTTNTGSKCERIDNVNVMQSLLQETEPYYLNKNIIGENLYTWNKNFIDKVMLSFSSTIVQNFSSKEKDLFYRYTSFLINGVDDVVDEDVIKLDEYIGGLV